LPMPHTMKVGLFSPRSEMLLGQLLRMRRKPSWILSFARRLVDGSTVVERALSDLMAKAGELGGSFGDNRTSRLISPVGRRCRDAQTFPQNEQSDVFACPIAGTSTKAKRQLCPTGIGDNRNAPGTGQTKRG